MSQVSGDNSTYTSSFHELSLLVPHLVTPLSRRIDKYLGGLPIQIQYTVLGRDPKTLVDAIALAATLSEDHVKAGTLTKDSIIKPAEKPIAEPTKETKPDSTTHRYHKHSLNHSTNKKRKPNYQNPNQPNQKVLHRPIPVVQIHANSIIPLPPSVAFAIIVAVTVTWLIIVVSLC